MQITRNSLDTYAGPSDWFTGSVYVDPIAAPADGARLSASSVHFTPGARTAWHTHPNGQKCPQNAAACRDSNRQVAAQAGGCGRRFLANSGDRGPQAAEGRLTFAAAMGRTIGRKRQVRDGEEPEQIPPLAALSDPLTHSSA